MKAPVSVVVLCGGRSTRMGRDKGALPFGDDTMLERIVRIMQATAEAVIVVARRDQSLPDGVTRINDPIEDLGPLAGIATGLAASTTELNIVVACDMPLIRPQVLERLLASVGEHDACVAIVDGYASALCAVYRKHVGVTAQMLLDSGERRVMRLLDRITTKRVDAALLRDIDPNLETFISVDTPEKYADALARIPDS